MTQPKLFDRSKLTLKALSERKSELDISLIKPLDAGYKASDDRWPLVAERIIDAKRTSSSVILMLGGHVVRSGVQNYLIDLMKRGYVSVIAVNGAVMIHDLELALTGKTTESVARYIKDGQFGLWKETGTLNDIINDAFRSEPLTGMGEAVGRAISQGKYPNKGISIFAAAFNFGIPLTVHVGIGYDIIHEHPNCDGASTGALSYNDFLRFASVVQKLDGGVVMDFGSAVMAPEVFLKALSMARNVKHKEGGSIKRFTTVVCDIQDVPADLSREPEKENPSYYFRPIKTLLVRTLDGGGSFYFKGKHSETVPSLWAAINNREKA